MIKQIYHWQKVFDKLFWSLLQFKEALKWKSPFFEGFPYTLAKLSICFTLPMFYLLEVQVEQQFQVLLYCIIILSYVLRLSFNI